MYRAPTGPVDTLQQALRKDLQNIPVPEPTLETAHRMAQILREIADAMRSAEEAGQRGLQIVSRRDDDAGTYWRRCS